MKTNDNQNILRHWREAVPHDRLAHLIRDTERAFRKSLQMRLAAHGVPFGHWSFLRILWEQDGLTQRELSDHAGVMEPTTFAAMKTMEAQGYVERRQLPTNKKNIYVYLTDHGRALKEKLVPLAEQVNHVSTGGVTATDVARTRKVLLAMIENLAQDEVDWNQQAGSQAPPAEPSKAAAKRAARPQKTAKKAD